MLTGIVFGRRSPGGNGGATADSDLLISRISEHRGRESMTIRIHADVMRRLRWIIGDYIVLKPGDDGQKWVVERVNGPKNQGLKITTASGKSSQHGRVSFTVDSEVLDEVFSGDSTSFTATLCDSSGNEAVFLRD
jgi:hypothetical protein